MLESLIDPQAQIADGYGLITFTMKDGKVVTGIIEKSQPASCRSRIPPATAR